MFIGVAAGLGLAAIIILIGVFKLMWRVAEPNEALIISGSTHRPEGLGEGMGFRIVTGRGTLVIPGVQAVRKLSLDLNETELSVDCVTHQGIPLKVRGVVIRVTGEAEAAANQARGLAVAAASRRRAWRRRRPSRRVRPRSPRTRRLSSPSSWPRSGRRSSRRARAPSAISTTWCC